MKQKNPAAAVLGHAIVWTFAICVIALLITATYKVILWML